MIENKIWFVSPLQKSFFSVFSDQGERGSRHDNIELIKISQSLLHLLTYFICEFYMADRIPQPH